MDGQSFNQVVGLLIAAIGVVAWGYVAVRAPNAHPVAAPVMLLLSLGMMIVSSLAVTDTDWWIGVFAATNRVIVAGSGVRAAWLLHARGARRES